jgi:hypothetical protein
MKSTIIILAFAFLSFTAVKAESPATMSVLYNAASGVYKVCYKSAETGRVKLAIYNANNNLVFSEVMNNISSFIRPYNFSQLSEGEYTIVLEDKNGKQVEKVNYRLNKIESIIRVSKLSGADNKFVLNVANTGSENIIVKIYDGSNNLLHVQTETVTGSFGLIYNLTPAKVASVRFEISTASGKTETITY